MKKFNIIIEETISQEFVVSADNYNEAIAIAKEKYSNCEFVLEPGNLISKEMKIYDSENFGVDWFEF